MNQVRVRSILCLSVVSLLAVQDAAGQTTFAEITGQVMDQTGSAIPGVEIEVLQRGTNYTFTATSNEVGAFTIPRLLEGSYTLRARSDGFQESVVRDIQLVARDVRRIDVRLSVGAVETIVEVTGGATLIETESARISDTKGSDQLKSLPLNTRSLWDFLGLSPNIVKGQGANRRFAGSRLNQADAAIDGISTSNNYDGTQISPLVSYIESYEEVRVDMANNSAEHGAVGMVTVISKKGSNQLHGAAFDYYQTPFFRARNPFAQERSTGIRHDFGGTIGGPIIKDRTFFFSSFERNSGSPTQQLLNPSVPLGPWRSGDFSGESDVLRDPTSGTPFANNTIPTTRLNPVTQRIQDRFYPLPNFGDTSSFRAQNYREMRIRDWDPTTYVTGRIDHRFSEKAFVYGRYTWQRQHSRPFEGNLPTIGQRWQQRDTRATALSYTHTLSPNLISEARWGFSFNDNPRHGPLMGREVVQDLGIQGLADNLPDIPGIFRVSFSQLGLTGINQQFWRNPGFKNLTHQFQEHISWFRGRHSVKAGFSLNYVLFADNIANQNLFGHANFSRRFTGHPYGDFLLGIPTSTNRAFAPELTERVRWSPSFFVTDEYRVNQKLTLSLGLRYEVMPGYRERFGRQAVFDPEFGSIVVPDGSLSLVSPLMPAGFVDVMEASQAGRHPTRLFDTDRNNFAPRIGIAYRPFGNSTVIRTGYGVFYDVTPARITAAGNPFIINEPTFTNPANNPSVVLPRVFPAGVGGPNSIGLPVGIRRDIRIPYSQQWNFTIEHQKWDTGFRASYIGKNTRQGEWNRNINQPIADDRLFVNKPRLFPQFPGITFIDNGANQQFHSLAFEAERRFAKGVAWQLSYTLSRDIADLARNESPEDAFDRRRERAVWIDIPTHRLTGNLIGELPFGQGKRFFNQAHGWKNAVVGGWQISAIYSMMSGQFLTPLWTGPDPTGTAFTASSTPAVVTIRPDHLRDANRPTSQRLTDDWFDINAFGAPGNGRFGTAAKGTIIGPGVNVINAGLSKYFDLTERLKLRWEFIATNITNTPNWSNPNTTITNVGQVGVITGVGGDNLDHAGPRSGRMSLRLEW